MSALAQIDEDWSILLSQSYQHMNAQGVFYQMPYASNGTTFTSTGTPVGSEPLPHLSVNLFNPSYDKDKFENTALTLNGKVGDLRLVYSGAYLVRNIEQVQDYTNYARGVFGSYYQCAGISPTNAAGRPVLHPEHDLARHGEEHSSNATKSGSAPRTTGASAALPAPSTSDSSPMTTQSGSTRRCRRAHRRLTTIASTTYSRSPVPTPRTRTSAATIPGSSPTSSEPSTRRPASARSTSTSSRRP